MRLVLVVFLFFIIFSIVYGQIDEDYEEGHQEQQQGITDINNNR